MNPWKSELDYDENSKKNFLVFTLKQPSIGIGESKMFRPNQSFLGDQSSDYGPIPVECQYYKMSDLNPFLQKKVGSQIRPEQDVKETLNDFFSDDQINSAH